VYIDEHDIGRRSANLRDGFVDILSCANNLEILAELRPNARQEQPVIIDQEQPDGRSHEVIGSTS
jgi:hypothetical protein